MGWKMASIFIKPVEDIDSKNVLNQLGLKVTKDIGTKSFEECINPSEKQFFIGKFNDTLVINSSDLAFEFYQKNLSEIEQKLIKIFPNSEIGAFTLHSTVNHWGYAIIESGIKVRIRFGDAEGGTHMEFGHILEEEKELLSQANFDENGKRYYTFEDLEDEKFYDDQVGENFVFSVTERFLDMNIDENDKLLFETQLVGYKVAPL